MVVGFMIVDERSTKVSNQLTLVQTIRDVGNHPGDGIIGEAIQEAEVLCVDMRKGTRKTGAAGWSGKKTC
jgi:hypothetical protein